MEDGTLRSHSLSLNPVSRKIGGVLLFVLRLRGRVRVGAFLCHDIKQWNAASAVDLRVGGAFSPRMEANDERGI